MSLTLAQHHKRHRTHRLVFITGIVGILLSGLGLGVVFLRVVGASASMTAFLSICDGPCPVPSAPVTTQPPAASVDSSSPAGQLAYLSPPPVPPVVPTPPEPPTVAPTDITLTLTLDDGTTVNGVVSAPDGGSGTSGGAQSSIPQFTTDRPTFHGTVGVPNALVFLELHSGTVFTTTIAADDTGRWSWQPSSALTHEVHTLAITVFDPSGDVRLGSATLQFEITGPGGPPLGAGAKHQGQSRTAIPIPPSLVDQRAVLFDIRARIVGMDQPYVIHPGDRIFIQVTLLNIGSPGKLVDAKVQYRLLGSDNTVLFTQQETVSVATQTSYLKIFTTKATMAEGSYRIEANVSYGDTEAVAYDSFKVAGAPVVPLFGTAKVDVSTLLEIFALILAIAVLVTYFEYKQLEIIRRLIHQVTEDDLKQQGLIV